MFRAVLLAGAIANTAAFIAPSRAPQCLAPQLAAGRAAVLPRRALPTASVTRRDEDDKRIDVLQELSDLRSAKARRALVFLMPVLVLVSCIFYSEVTTPWTALDALFFGPR